jgi:hypothetical protein
MSSPPAQLAREDNGHVFDAGVAATAVMVISMIFPPNGHQMRKICKGQGNISNSLMA